MILTKTVRSSFWCSAKWQVDETKSLQKSFF